MRRRWPFVFLRLLLLLSFSPASGDPPLDDEPPSLWRWKFQPISGKIGMISPVSSTAERSIELLEYVKSDAHDREPFSGQAVAYHLGRLGLVFRSEGPGDPPLVWPAIEMFCQDMIDYAERGALLQVEGLLTNNIHPDWAISAVVRISGGGSIGNEMVVL